MENKGITILSLVITVIILLILAGITLNLTLGENGIITMAQKAKEKTELAQKEEEQKLNEIYTQIGLEEEQTSQSGTFKDIITAQNYGDSVRYSENGIDDWKIFYKNENGVYIITAGFARVDRMWDIRATYSSSSGWRDYPYKLSFSTKESTGSIYTNTEVLNLFMSSKYELTSKYNSSRMASAFLRDDYWKYYVDGNWADYAVGSPTLEMLMASYCEKYNLNVSHSVVSNGYNFPTVKDENGTEVNINAGNGISDELYWIKGSNDCLLSSPQGDKGLWILDQSNSYCWLTAFQSPSGGVRPVVHLRADVKAKKDEETGKWILQ